MTFLLLGRFLVRAVCCLLRNRCGCVLNRYLLCRNLHILLCGLLLLLLCKNSIAVLVQTEIDARHRLLGCHRACMDRRCATSDKHRGQYCCDPFYILSVHVIPHFYQRMLNIHSKCYTYITKEL